MARQKRFYVPDVPCHVIQRGNNRQACFFDVCDYEFYLECLQDACDKYDCKLHAYVLMTNHVHLLLTPGHEKSLSALMQSVGRRYVKWINNIYKRSGTLWEGRYKSSLVASEGYLLSCYRYIELNPVRASMVEHPAEYRWSSYRMNAGEDLLNWLNPHEEYFRLGATDELRFLRYQALFDLDIDASWFTNKTLKEQPLGNSRFKEQIEGMLSVKFNREYIGRPENATDPVKRDSAKQSIELIL